LNKSRFLKTNRFSVAYFRCKPDTMVTGCIEGRSCAVRGSWIGRLVGPVDVVTRDGLKLYVRPAVTADAIDAF
jgi:hypothetical protein